MKRYNLNTYGYSRLFDEDINGEWVKWEDVPEGDEPCEGCHLPPVSCNGFTLKQACEHIERLHEALEKHEAHMTAMQREAELYLIPDNDCNRDWFVSRMLWNLDGPQQREVQRIAREALEKREEV